MRFWIILSSSFLSQFCVILNFFTWILWQIKFSFTYFKWPNETEKSIEKFGLWDLVKSWNLYQSFYLTLGIWLVGLSFVIFSSSSSSKSSSFSIVLLWKAAGVIHFFAILLQFCQQSFQQVYFLVFSVQKCHVWILFSFLLLPGNSFCCQLFLSRL